MMMMLLKWRHTDFFEVWFPHNLLKIHNLAKHVTLGHQNWMKVKGAGGREPTALGNFWKFVTKTMHFRHNLNKIQLKICNNISIGVGMGGPLSPPPPWWCPCDIQT